MNSDLALWTISVSLELIFLYEVIADAWCTPILPTHPLCVRVHASFPILHQTFFGRSNVVKKSSFASFDRRFDPSSL